MLSTRLVATPVASVSEIPGPPWPQPGPRDGNVYFW